MQVYYAGVQDLSTVDFPKKLCSVIFFQGCNLNCNYCHSAELIPLDSVDKKYISEQEVLSYISDHKKMLDGIVLLGGEPTIQEGLLDFCIKVRELFPELSIKLDTNGLRPDVIKKLIENKVIDYVAMDIKEEAIRKGYGSYTESIDYLIDEVSIDYEFRLTCCPSVVNEDNIETLLGCFKGATKVILQRFSNLNCNDKSTPYPDEILEAWANKYSHLFGSLTVR